MVMSFLEAKAVRQRNEPSCENVKDGVIEVFGNLINNTVERINAVGDKS